MESREARVMGTVTGQQISFVADTGATLFLLTPWSGPSEQSHTPVMGISGTNSFLQQTPKVLCSFGLVPFTHYFLIMPQSLIPLLGQDIFHKLGAALHIPPLNSTTIFLLQQIPAAPPLLKPPDFLSPLIPEFQIDSWVSDTQHPQVAHHHKPLLITLKDPTIFDTIPQYPLHPSTLPGLKSIISQLLQAQLLILICSPQNTPIVGVKKPNSDYQLVQDLRKINELSYPPIPWFPILIPFFLLFLQLPGSSQH
jgi:hypothetical protein